MLYDKLLNVWRRERLDNKILQIEEDFFQKYQTYLNHLETISKDSVESELTQKVFYKRFLRVNYLINDLIRMRLEKFYLAILKNQPLPENISMEETTFSKQLQKLIKNHYDEALGLNKEKVEEDFMSVDDTYEFCLLTKDENDKIIGGDLQVYGPFKKGDIALLPTENVRNFVIRNIGRKLTILD